MAFQENQQVDDVMYDYSKSKHVDVQQRAIEYKVLKVNASRVSQDIMMKTPLNDATVTQQGFDFELRFLDSYVQSQVS